MKHWLVQAVNRDPRTKLIVGRQRSRTVPPAIGARMIAKDPAGWEVLDTSYEVPDDPRAPRGGVKWDVEPLPGSGKVTEVKPGEMGMPKRKG